MIEINYESMLKALIPKIYLSHFFRSNSDPTYFIHLDIPKSPEVRIRDYQSSSDIVLLGKGISSFEAWKDAYFNVVKKLTND